MQAYKEMSSSNLLVLRQSFSDSRNAMIKLWSYSAVENDFRKKDLVLFSEAIEKIDKELKSREYGALLA